VRAISRLRAPGNPAGPLTAANGNVRDLDRRTDALGHELEDVIKEFDQLKTKQLPDINAGLQKKKLEKLQPLTQEQWEKTHEGGSVQQGAMNRWERD
jgi:hypothetical protein